MPPRGRPKGSTNKVAKTKLSPTEQLEKHASSQGLTGGESDYQTDHQPIPRGRPRTNHLRRTEDNTDGGEVRSVPKGRPSYASQTGPQGFYRKTSGKKVLEKKLPRDHGRPTPGKFPYECDCGVHPIGKHWIFSVAEWENHMTKDFLDKLQARSIAATLDDHLPARFAGLYDPIELATLADLPQPDLPSSSTNNPLPKENPFSDIDADVSDLDTSVVRQLPRLQPEETKNNKHMTSLGLKLGDPSIPAKEQRRTMRARTRLALDVITKRKAKEDAVASEARREARRLVREKDREERKRQRKEEAKRMEKKGATRVPRETLKARSENAHVFEAMQYEFEHRQALRIQRGIAALQFSDLLSNAQNVHLDTADLLGGLGRNTITMADLGTLTVAEIERVLNDPSVRTNNVPGNSTEMEGNIRQDITRILIPSADCNGVPIPVVIPDVSAESDDEFDNDGMSSSEVEDLRGSGDSSEDDDLVTDEDDPLLPQNDCFDYRNASRQHMDQKIFGSLALLQMRQDGGLSVNMLRQVSKLVTALLILPENTPYEFRTTRKKLAIRTNIRHVRYDVCPKNCFCYAALPRAKKCPECGTARLPPGSRDGITFDYIPVIPRLRLQYSDRDFARTVTTYRAKVMSMYEETGVRSDFWTGNIHKEHLRLGLFQEATDLGFALYTDGVQVFKQRVVFGVWPIVLVNISLPPEIRYLDENIIIVGIIPGPDPPINMNSFLYPFVQEFMMLQEGVEGVFNGLTGSTFVLRAHVCVVCCDQKGREKVQGTVGTPAYAYCPYCHAHGHQGPGHTYCPYKAPLDDSQGRPVPPADATFERRYDRNGFPLFFEFDLASGGAPRKEHKHFVEGYDHYVNYKDSEFTVRRWGVNNFNILHDLFSLFSSRSYPVDEMHLLYIGACKQHFDILRGATMARIPDQTKVDTPRNTNENGKRSKASRKESRKERDIREDSDLDMHWTEGRDSSESHSDSESPSNSDDGEGDHTVKKRKVHVAKGKPTQTNATAKDPKPTLKEKGQKQKRPKKNVRFLPTEESFGVQPRDWWEMNHDMNHTRLLGGIPTDFGYNIRGIAEFSSFYKAEEWKTFFNRYFPIYFRDRFPPDEPEHYLRNMDFIRALHLCSLHYLTDAEINEVEECIIRFMDYYEKMIYQRKYERLIIYTSTIHHLGHLKGCIEDCGPMYVFACWVIERVNNMLSRCAQNKRDTNRNLSINILSREHFNFLRYTFSTDSFEGTIPVTSQVNHQRANTASHSASEPQQSQTGSSINTLSVDFSKGFETSAERACAFASFKMYLQIVRNAKELEENDSLDSEERARKAAQQVDDFVRQRNRDMGKKRGRTHRMASEFDNATKHRVATTVGNGTPYNKTNESASFTPEIRIALIRDQKGIWTNLSSEDWDLLRTRPFTGCNITMKAEFAASVFSVSSSRLRKKGNKRGNSLVLVCDRDAYKNPDFSDVEDFSDPEQEHNRNAPVTVCEVLYFFKVELRPVKKKRAVRKLFVNPLFEDPAPEPPQFDDTTIFAAVQYYKVRNDKSFLVIGDKPNERVHVILATDIEDLIGFVFDRGQRVLVDKFSPIYDGGFFNPSLYEKKGKKAMGKATCRKRPDKQ